MAGKFEIKAGRTGKFRFNLKASNGQTILSSEAYESRSAANKGIQSVKRNAGNDKRFERKTGKDGSAFFVMKAANGEPIGRSEMYRTTRSMESGIASVAKNAPDAPVADADAKPAAKSAAGSATKTSSTPAAKPASKAAPKASAAVTSAASTAKSAPKTAAKKTVKK
jgi:uncharacterized protein YegP (UPF0339 family)